MWRPPFLNPFIVAVKIKTTFNFRFLFLKSAAL